MKVRHVLSGFSLALLAACGDDNGIGPSTGDRFTTAEAMMIASAFNSSVTGASSEASSAGTANAGASVPQAIHMTVSQTAPCPLGGQTALSVTMDGTVDDATQSMNLDMTATNAPASCVLQAGEVTVTVTGTPHLQHAAHMEVSNGEPVGTWTSGGKGSFSWTASDGRSGTCSVDYSMSMNFTAQQVALNGHFCGASITYSAPMSPGA